MSRFELDTRIAAHCELVKGSIIHYNAKFYQCEKFTRKSIYVRDTAFDGHSLKLSRIPSYAVKQYSELIFQSIETINAIDVHTGYYIKPKMEKVFLRVYTVNRSLNDDLNLEYVKIKFYYGHKQFFEIHANPDDEFDVVSITKENPFEKVGKK